MLSDLLRRKMLSQIHQGKWKCHNHHKLSTLLQCAQTRLGKGACLQIVPEKYIVIT